jgi:hypothetical protein
VETSNQESQQKCYLCGRNEKEFTSIFNSSIYDKDISQLESSISEKLKMLSNEITTILQRTEQYDRTIPIMELRVNDRIYSKFMPDWSLLLNYLKNFNFSRNETLIGVRDKLINATVKLDNGEIPETINLDAQTLSDNEKLQSLKSKKAILENLIANPAFKTYETTLESNKEKIVVKFKLCPVCSDLHTKYHDSIAEDDDWTWMYE